MGFSGSIVLINTSLDLDDVQKIEDRTLEEGCHPTEVETGGKVPFWRF